MESSWESLRPELLDLILDLLPLPDYLRFPAICQSWRQVHTGHRLRGGPATCRQMPWLMLPEDKQSPEKWLFYSPSEQRCYKIPLPVSAQGKHCCGISHGWLLLLEPVRSCEVLLLINPLTLSEIKVPIFPDMNQDSLGVLSSSPADPDCIVLLWFSESVFYCRINDWMWGTLINLVDLPVKRCPPVFSAGKIYTDDGPSTLFEVVPLPAKLGNISWIEMVGFPESVQDTKVFVECDGDLMLLVGFMVFKADLDKKRWVKLESLGDNVFFLGDGHALCLPAVNTGGPMNRIYSTCTLDHFKKGSTSSILLVEEDYWTHEIVSRELPNLREPGQERFKFDLLRWIVPSLH